MVPCIAIFDIGKTNKKCLLFDHYYNIVHEVATQFAEIPDDDGDPGEDIAQLTNWLLATWRDLEADERFKVVALNFTTYGASLVHLNTRFTPATPLYSYLKFYPQKIQDQFYNRYGDKLTFATQTASPNLGMLNSGLQLYWLKYQKPELYAQIKYTLHLPQYCSFLFTRTKVSDYTSIGCHTGLWNFKNQQYHRWVYEENVIGLLPRIAEHENKFCTTFRKERIPVGIGLHDSSSALIPYLKKYTDPFLLLSTGTWGITLNPFAKENLTTRDLQQDCLNFLTYQGQPVKASRLFIGNEHEEQVKKLAAHYNKPEDYYKIVPLQPSYLSAEMFEQVSANNISQAEIKSPKLNIKLDLSQYDTYEEAYHRLIFKITEPQLAAIRLAGEYNLSTFKYLLVDGGFCKNKIFMHLLQQAFPNLTVVVSENSQGTALGAAMLLNVW